ncbi:MAG: cell division protein FtsQ/DivIB [Proteobacteria bacterium]|nr:cell division protein FtsQ/DivIB [Pseudomonadota bacterium]
MPIDSVSQTEHLACCPSPSQKATPNRTIALGIRRNATLCRKNNRRVGSYTQLITRLTGLLSNSRSWGEIEALPWVRVAVVSRELPGTLKVWVKERTPFARWQIGGQLMLIDETAAVIAGSDLKEFSRLPFIVGPGAPAAAAELFSVLASEPELSARVVSAIRVGDRRWDLEFDNGMRLKLPEQSKTHGPARAWKRFAEMEAEKGILSLGVMVIDLRLADRVVMKLTPEGRKLYQNMDQET